MILDDLPTGLRPTVQVIDDWVTARKLGLVFEGKVRQGRLLVCSIDLERSLATNAVARQLRKSLLEYMAGDRFQPNATLTVEQIRGLMSPAPALERLGARVLKADSFEPGFEPSNALDGLPTTLWHTAWTGGTPGFPHEIQLELKQPALLRGLTALPRQDNNPNGWIKDYEVYVSPDGNDWGEPVAKGAFAKTAQRQTVLFAKPQLVHYLRLVALSGQTSGPWASLAELDVLTADSP